MDLKKKEITKLKETISNLDIENNNLKQINELKRKTKFELVNPNKAKINKNSILEHANITHNPKKACI